jgi:uncharacterized protein YlxW (UPF0749 family)
MSDAAIATVVTAAAAFGGSILAVVGVWLAGRQRLEELRIANELAAVKVETVRTTLARSTEVADKKLDSIHEIVNSQRTAMEQKIEELRQLLAESRRREE